MAENLTPQTASADLSGPILSARDEVHTGSIEGTAPPLSGMQQVLLKNRRLILFIAGALMFLGFVGLML
ncbi:MAG: hypothetical protein Q9M19_02915, partial [Mariprofundaceae bacterium]|nr:hypothetical protein [Mariprofundaceae bacterium]